MKAKPSISAPTITIAPPWEPKPYPQRRDWIDPELVPKPRRAIRPKGEADERYAVKARKKAAKGKP